MSIRALIEKLISDPSWASIRDARKVLRGELRRAETLELSRFLNSPAIRLRSDFESRRVRIGLASDTSLESLELPLSLRLLERGMLAVQYHCPFGQIAQAVRGQRSDLLEFQPDVIVLAPLTGAWSRIGETSATTAVEVVANAWSHVEALRDRYDGLILLVNFVEAEGRPTGVLDAASDLGRVDFARSVNLELSRRCRQGGIAHVVDASFLASHSGALWPTLHKHIFLAGQPLSDELADTIAVDIVAFCAALKGFARKCLVVDLDNTIWGGIVGEDGPLGVQIGQTYPGNIFIALQREIKQLRDRGITIAIVSKNNEDDAWGVIENRPEMVLHRSDFSAYRINWHDKAANICSLAEELKLTLDAFVVVDDNPVERARIEEALPEVEVCPVGDPLQILRWLVTCHRFDTLRLTAEDSIRTNSYAAAQARTRAAAASSNLPDYLASLGMKVRVGRMTRRELPRVSQLTQKTNQFNLTTKRYTEPQLLALLDNPAWAVYWCHCRDRLSNDGIVGVAIARIAATEWHVDTFLLSCRVLGRDVEKAFIEAVCCDAADHGATSMIGEFVRTSKNSQAASFWESCGFIEIESTPERVNWKRALPITARLMPGWIDLDDDNSPDVTGPNR